MASEVIILPDGAIEARGESRLRLAVFSGSYRLLHADGHAILLAPRDSNQRVLMSGELIGSQTVVELVSTIANLGWSGELIVNGGPTSRFLFIDKGALRGAYANVPAERLGEVMLAAGVLDRAQLASCLREAGPQRRLGEVAIDRGLLDQQRLFDMLRVQAEQIFQNALLVRSGSYAFLLAGDDTEAPAMTIHVPIQSLLLESVQRIDEMALLRQRIPSGDLCPLVSEAGPRVTLRESLRPVAMLSDGQTSILDIARELKIDELTVTKQVMQLLQLGYVELKDRQVLTEETVGPIVRQLNDILSEIRDTVGRHGSTQEMGWTFQQWVRDSRLDQYFGDDIGIGGDLSVERTLRQLARIEDERPLEALTRAAKELASFAMFSASPNLPRDAERALNKWVNQRMTRLGVPVSLRPPTPT